MQQRTKRILLLIVFVLLVGALGYVLWFFFFRPLLGPEVTPPPSGGQEQLPPTGGVTIPGALPGTVTPVTPGGVTTPAGIITPPGVQRPLALSAQGGATIFGILEEHPVVQPKLSTNGRDVVYYDSSTSYFYRITPDGTKELYSDAAFSGVQTVAWSPDNRRAVLEYGDGSNVMYNFQTKQAVTLPAQWKEFAFSTDGGSIVFKDMKLDPENRYLTVADVNGQGERKIERLGTKDADVQVTWSPNNQYVALYRQSIDLDRSEVTFIGMNDQNFRTVTVEGRDLRFEWSPSGRKMIYSAYNGRSEYKPELWVTFTEPDLLGTGKNKLNLQTWADKCVFADENQIICAVPRTLERGAGIAPDIAAGVPDDFYRVNVLTGATALLAQPLVSTTATNLLVSADGAYLYWTDARNGSLNKMDLK